MEGWIILGLFYLGVVSASAVGTWIVLCAFVHKIANAVEKSSARTPPGPRRDGEF